MSDDIRICFVGDSLVNGTGDETTLGWVGRLCAEANARGFAVTCYNLGIRRNTSADILARWEGECALRQPHEADNRVVISCGVNDTVIEESRPRVPADTSCANVREILNRARRFPLLMIGPPPVGDPEQNGRIDALSRAYAKEAAALDTGYIELFAELIEDEHYLRDVSLNDGSHPTSSGYSKMTEIINRSPYWWFNNRELK